MSKDWFILSRQKIKWLIGYYIILFILGIILTLFALLYESFQIQLKMNISLISIIGGFGTALFGSSTFYLRKLYKASINKEMSSPTNEDERIKELGIYAYYFLRPLFAIGFSILIHIVLKSSVQIITVKETLLDDGFIYLVMFFSFFGGFAAGDFLTYIEIQSDNIAKKLFK